ncbi:hypothetical protein IJG14_04890 [bacterium]|nr:hypothetical protein [bacterium]
MLGIYIHNVKNKEGKTSKKGKNPFDKWDWSNTTSGKPKVYDWVDDNGYNNIGKWIELAASNKSV